MSTNGPGKVVKITKGKRKSEEPPLMKPFHEMLEEDLENENTKDAPHENASDRPAIILGSPGGAWKRPRLLGPILSARFKSSHTTCARGSKNRKWAPYLEAG